MKMAAKILALHHVTDHGGSELDELLQDLPLVQVGLIETKYLIQRHYLINGKNLLVTYRVLLTVLRKSKPDVIV